MTRQRLDEGTHLRPDLHHLRHPHRPHRGRAEDSAAGHGDRPPRLPARARPHARARRRAPARAPRRARLPGHGDHRARRRARHASLRRSRPWRARPSRARAEVYGATPSSTRSTRRAAPSARSAARHKPPTPVVSFGVSYAGSNPHGPDENMRLDDFIQGIKYFGRVIHRLATSKRATRRAAATERLEPRSSSTRRRQLELPRGERSAMIKALNFIRAKRCRGKLADQRPRASSRNREAARGDSPPRGAVLRPRQPGNFRRRVRRAARAPARARRGAPGAASRRTARRSASAGGPPRGSRSTSTGGRCCRSTTATTSKTCAPSTSAAASSPTGARFEYVAELKIDGLSISLHYEDGVLARGVTRGDGRVGEDVTQNVAHHPQRPARAQRRRGHAGEVEVRGEAYLSRKDFERINAEREEAERAALRQPAQRRRRHHPPARPEGRRRAAASTSSPTTCSRGERKAFARTGRRSNGSSARASASTRTASCARRSTR